MCLLVFSFWLFPSGLAAANHQPPFKPSSLHLLFSLTTNFTCSSTASERLPFVLLLASCLALPTSASFHWHVRCASSVRVQQPDSLDSNMNIEHALCLRVLIPDPVRPAHCQGEAQHFNLCYLQLGLLSCSSVPPSLNHTNRATQLLPSESPC